MQPVSDFIRYLRFTDGIASSDLIGWLLAALAGVIAYKLIDHMQTAIERHSMLSAVEDSFSQLFNAKIAVSLEPGEELNEKSAKKHKVMVRSVLHDYSDWKIVYAGGSDSPEAGVPESKIIRNQRYVHIRDDKNYNEWISTQALHEIILKSRRIEKMFKGGVVKRIDLADMFRELMPLGISGRLEFFKTYYDDYDAECLGYLIMQTVVSCDKYGNSSIVSEFVQYYKSHPEIQSLFKDNRRVRPFADFFAKLHFDRIVND